MITVPWVMDNWSTNRPMSPIADNDAITSFAKRFWGQAWADFLFEHATNIKVKSYYDPATMLHNVDFQFHLPPEQETMYRLRFN